MYVLHARLRNKCSSLNSDLFRNHIRNNIMWASTRENLSSGFANSKGADQSAHPRRLISAFVIRFSKSIISKLASREISIF